MKKWMFLIVCLLPALGWAQELKQGKYVEWEIEAGMKSEVFTFGEQGAMVFTEAEELPTSYHLDWYDKTLIKGKSESFLYPKKSKHTSWYKNDSGLFIFWVDKKSNEFKVYIHNPVTLERREIGGKLEKFKRRISRVIVLGEYLYLQTNIATEETGVWDSFHIINLVSGESTYLNFGGKRKNIDSHFYQSDMEIINHPINPEVWIKCRECKSPLKEIECKNWVLRYDKKGQKLEPITIKVPKGHSISSFTTFKLDTLENYFLIGGFRASKTRNERYTFSYDVQRAEGVFSGFLDASEGMEGTEFYANDKFDKSPSILVFHPIKWDGEKYVINIEGFWNSSKDYDQKIYKAENRGGLLMTFDEEGSLIEYVLFHLKTFKRYLNTLQLAVGQDEIEYAVVYATPSHDVNIEYPKEYEIIFRGIEFNSDDLEDRTRIKSLVFPTKDSDNEIRQRPHPEVLHWHGNNFLGWGTMAIVKKGKKRLKDIRNVFFLMQINYTN